jgi:phenylalanyl-tRNA synthetase beta chain
MKLSRDWINDYVDLSGIDDDALGVRLTEIGHAIDSVERHGDDTVFDLEITTNRVDAMSHLGMARELAAALGRELKSPWQSVATATKTGDVTIRIEAPEMCRRFAGLVIRGVTIKPSPPDVQRRLEAVGLRPINNIVDITNYVMLAAGHPMHAYDLDRVGGKTIIVRAGKAGESMKTLDGETRKITADTVVIADANGPVGLGGVMGGGNSEISATTKNVLLECAWFEPSLIRRTARRLGMKTDASYRFERRVDPNDCAGVVELAARMILDLAGGEAELPIDVVAVETKPETIRLRTAKLHEQSANAVGDGYALELFRRMGWDAQTASDGLLITVPTYRGDIHEEMDLVEEVLRFYGFNNVPASLPRLTIGDVRRETADVVNDAIRDILVGCGMSEVVTYSFIHRDVNALFTAEEPIAITNALTENLASMRLTLLPGLLEAVVFNRSYGNRDGGLFEAGRTYHRASGGVQERHRVAIVLFGTIGTFWGDAKRAVDFFDVKGIVEQVAAKLHVDVTFRDGDQRWLRKGKRAIALHGDREVASIGFPSQDVLQHFGIKGDVAAAEIDTDALIAATGAWTMAPVARFPGVPMILAMTHGPDLHYSQIIDAIRSFGIEYLHEVGLRDRFAPDPNTIKTTLGMWYQAFDRSLTQDEVNASQQRLASRLADMLPVKLL